MKQYIAQRSFPNKLKSDILKLGAMAKADAATGNKVINATIGAFLNDDKTLNLVPSVISSINKHLETSMGYPPIAGGPLYKEGLLRWFFKDNYDSIMSKFYVPFTASLGGTGALSLAFNIFLDQNHTVLLPSIMWSNYKLIAEKARLNHDTYELFNENKKFNIDSLCSKIKEYQEVQDNILVVINDPCQNPTGYSLSDSEYEELIDRLNELSIEKKVTVLFDIAYLDYDSNNQQMHRLFKYMTTKETNFLCIFAASCSKIFGMYGLRVGALFALTKDIDFSTDLVTALESHIRGTYSCPNGPALQSLGFLLTKEFSEKVSNEIYQNTVVLNERTHYFISLLEKYNLEYLPYVNGFFVTLKVKNAQNIFDLLKEKHTYVIPIAQDLIRIAVCSLNKIEIEELTLQLVEILK